MNYQTIKKASVAALLAGSLLLPSVALAQDASASPSARLGWRARCERIEARVAGRVAHFKSVNDRHATHYRNLALRVRKIIDTLSSRGYDTAIVEGDLKTLNQMIQHAADDHAAFITQLEEAQAFDCGKSEGAFRQAMQEARDALKVVRDDARAIKDFYQNTLRPHIQDLRNQHPSPSPSV